MRIQNGCIYLSQRDTKRFQTSDVFRQDVTDIMSDMLHKPEQCKTSVLVYDCNGHYVAGLWIGAKHEKTKKAPTPKG